MESHTIGQVLFWDKIAPILIRTQRTIGFSYVFLFAADASEDQVLMNFYHDALKFQQVEDVGTQKPLFDLLCSFMAQKMDDLQTARVQFYENFNVEGADVV